METVRTYELDTAVSVSALGGSRRRRDFLLLVSYNSYTVLKCVLNVEATLLEPQNAYFGSVSYRNRMSQITIYLKSIVSDQYLPEASVSNHYLPGRVASQITIYHDIVSSSVSNDYLPPAV